MHRSRRAALFLCLMLLAPYGRARGCDICAVYTGFELQATEKGLRLGLAEQFTRFATLQDNGTEIANPYGERMNSSITQFLLGYQFHRRFGAQVIVPVISRSYRRLASIGAVSGRATVESGEVSGFGDMTLLANALAYDYTSEDTLALVTLYGGIELPSGNPNQLGEEAPPEEPAPALPSRSTIESLPRFSAKDARGGTHHGVPSGIHGHDLALGSGSVDGVFGLKTFGYWRRLYAEAWVQYFLRSEGSFDYEYANLFVATAGPGYFILSEDDYTLGVQALLTVETKGKDWLGDQSVDDTAYTGLYAGPAFHFTWSTSLSADLAAEIPALQNSTGLQIVPDWRLRLGAIWRF